MHSFWYLLRRDTKGVRKFLNYIKKRYKLLEILQNTRRLVDFFFTFPRVTILLYNIPNKKPKQNKINVIIKTRCQID